MSWLITAHSFLSLNWDEWASIVLILGTIYAGTKKIINKQVSNVLRPINENLTEFNQNFQKFNSWRQEADRRLERGDKKFLKQEDRLDDHERRITDHEQRLRNLEGTGKKESEFYENYRKEHQR